MGLFSDEPKIRGIKGIKVQKRRDMIKEEKRQKLGKEWPAKGKKPVKNDAWKGRGWW